MELREKEWPLLELEPEEVSAQSAACIANAKDERQAVRVRVKGWSEGLEEERNEMGWLLALRSPFGHAGIFVSFELAAAATDGNEEDWHACCKSASDVPSGYLYQNQKPDGDECPDV